MYLIGIIVMQNIHESKLKSTTGHVLPNYLVYTFRIAVN